MIDPDVKSRGSKYLGLPFVFNILSNILKSSEGVFTMQEHKYRQFPHVISNLSCQ